MREARRAVAMLVRTAWRTDRWRSIGLLLEPLGRLRLPFFAWCLGVMADGLLRRDTRLLAVGAAGIVVAQVLWFAGSWTGAWIRARLVEEVGFALDREMAELAARVPGVEHHERADYQDRLELLRQEQGVLGGALNTLVYTANVVVTAAGTLVGLALVSPWLLLLVPFALPALPIAAAQQRWLRDADARAITPGRRARHLLALALDRNAGMELRVFGLRDELRARFRDAWRAARAPRIAVGNRVALLNGVAELVFVAGFAGAVALMLWRVGRGLATAGEVITALYLAQQVRASVVDPVQQVAGLGQMVRTAGRMLWLQDFARAAAARAGFRSAPARLRDGIVFDRVSFRYPGTERWVVRDLTLRIPAGTVVALVGENGAGKTTLVKLLTRMYEPTGGRILVDGVDLAEIEVEGWRARLSAAFQDFARFEMPAGEAVAMGDLPRVGDEAAAREALARAGGDGLLDQLPNGADTQLGARWENGVDLSTGQWQKVAVGRALMRRDPLVVFFDEPTAALDALAEHALFERYAREARSGTERGAVTVLVSHRFSTVRSADLILVVDGGGVIEVGHHDELILRDGLYAELYSLQARAYG